MGELTTLKLFERIEKLMVLYSNEMITPKHYKDEMLELRKLAEELDRKKRDDERKILELELQLATAYIDSLTGLFIRKVLGDKEICKQIPTTSTFVICDIDNFGGINNKYGHIIGDEVLKIIGQKVREVVRSSDFAIRYGGDEVVIILPNCPQEKAEERCAEIRNLVFETVKQAVFTNENGLTSIIVEEPITMSFGIYSRTDEDMSIKDSIELADRVLYYSKAHKKGVDKSGISIYSEEMPKIRG